MKLISLILSFCAISIWSSSVAASVNTDYFKYKLDQCRFDYKTMAANLQKKIDEKIKQGGSVQSIKSKIVSEYQDRLNEKANECKTLKEILEKAPIVEETILNAPSGEKLGPILRCFQLGQNKKEVLQCSKSVGYQEYPFVPSESYLAMRFVMQLAHIEQESTYDNPFFVTYLRSNNGGEEIIVRHSGKDFTVNKIEIYGTDFWGASQLDKTFLTEMQKNYHFLLLPRSEWANEYTTMTTYFHEDDGWNIGVYPETLPPLVVVVKTVHSSKLKF